MKLTVDCVSGMAATTAGNGSVPIDTPIGSGTSVPTLVSRCSCCQFCPFTDGAIYTSLPAQIKCTLTDEFHFCDDTHCDVKEKLIPIEWIKEWEQKDENFFLYMGLTKKLIEDWEKENE